MHVPPNRRKARLREVPGEDAAMEMSALAQEAVRAMRGRAAADHAAQLEDVLGMLRTGGRPQGLGPDT